MREMLTRCPQQAAVHMHARKKETLGKTRTNRGLEKQKTDAGRRANGFETHGELGFVRGAAGTKNLVVAER